MVLVLGRDISVDHLGSELPQALKPAARRARDLAQGTWPAPVADWRLARTTRVPETFAEKVRYRSAFDRRPLLTTLVDKVAVRDYVAERIGSEHLAGLVGAYDSATAIPWGSLPREFALKGSHGSGAVVVVWDGAPEESRLPASARFVDWDRFGIRPEHASRPRMAALAEKWLKLNYHRGPGRLPEWAYRDVPARVMVEELIPGIGTALPTDYKCLVFDGVCKLFYVVDGRFGDHRIAVFLADGTPAPAGLLHPRPQTMPALAPNWREVIAAAEELGRGLDFVRVDLYPTDGGYAFGEMTVYHDAGHNGWDPPEYDREVGSWWTLPDAVELRTPR